MPTREWVLKRNCSLTPCQSACAIAVPGLFSLGFASLFAWHGAWFVLAFAALEMAAIALAFFHFARHAGDRESIVLAGDSLLIERMHGGRLWQTRLNPCWTRVGLPGRACSLIHLESCGQQIDLGRYVTQSMRRQVARELRQALGGVPDNISRRHRPDGQG